MYIHTYVIFCKYISIYVCRHACMYVCEFIYNSSISLWVLYDIRSHDNTMCVYIYIYRYACMRVMYLRMYAPVYVSMCMCMYACMHLCTHERIGEFQGLALRAPLPARAVPSEHRCTITLLVEAFEISAPGGPRFFASS